MGDDIRVSNTDGRETVADRPERTWNPIPVVPESLWDLAGSQLVT